MKPMQKPMQFNPGAPSEVQPANKKIQDICDQFRMEVEKNKKNKFDKFVAVNFKTQVVAGTNFFIKVDVGNDWCVHLSVWQHLPCDGGKLSLSGVQEGKRLDEEIVSF